MSELKKKIEFKNIFKIFGRNPLKAKELYEKGVSKDDILARMKHTIGVADASFDVHEGETVVVMGLSGSGKSTLLRCANRLIEPSYGNIRIDGVDVTKLDHEQLLEFRRTKFGMVFQRFALFPHRTVLENACFGLEIQRRLPSEQKDKAAGALELVGLKGWEDSYPHQLSGGMQQRVGLARALAVEPDILLMDEAFSALDPLIRTDMQDELLSLETKVQKTILFITHDLDEALKMGDRIVLMKDGKIVQIGTSEEILTQPATEYVRRFVENVDITKVLTASDVMKRPQSVVLVKDGPRTALHNMKENNMSGLYVLNKDHSVVGYITAEQASKAVKNGVTKFDDIMEDLDHPVDPDTPIKEIFHKMMLNDYPLSVLDKDNKLRGIINHGTIIAALAERGDVNETS